MNESPQREQGAAAKDAIDVKDAMRDPRLVMGAVLSVAWFTLPLVCSIVLFARLGPLTEWLQGHGDSAPWIAAGLFAACAGLGLLPTYAQAVFAGWVFGTATGTMVAVSGYVGAAVIGYLLCSAVLRDAATQRIDAHPRWRIVREALVDAKPWRTMGIVALLRFPPTSPFAFTNLVLAASGVRFLHMLVGSIVGMLPRTVLAVWIGAQGAATGAKDLSELMDKQGIAAVVIGTASLIAALAVLQHVGKRALRAAGLS